MFKIEKNIPLPTTTQDAEKYPFNQMEIGDSFIASTDIKSFSDIADDVDGRNEAGDGRMFIYASEADYESGLNMLRVWRVSPEAYLDKHPEEKEILNWMLTIVEGLAPMTRSQIVYYNLANGPGSKAKRYLILDKYAFLFKITKGKTHGFIYDIA